MLNKCLCRVACRRLCLVRRLAWLRGADFVSPDDVQAVAYDVLRHRIILSFEAEANGISEDQVISDLISKVPVT